MNAHVRSFRSVPLAALLTVATLASTGPAREDLVVAGHVVSAGTGAPLAGAQIYVAETGVGTLSDGAGAYALVVPRVRLPAGEIHVVAQLIGYQWETRTLSAAEALAADTVTIDFRMREQAIALDELVVTGDANAVARARRERTEPSARAAAAPPPPPFRAWPGPTSTRAWPAPTQDREQYAHIAENGFQAVKDHPLSTFSIDVDRASYSNVRRFLLRERRLPPVDAVQIEEMVNYFSYDYALPRGDHPVAVTAELGDAPWARGHQLLRVGLASRPIDTAEMPPINLVFLLDVSGSMNSPDKLPLVKASMRLLVDQLRPTDRIAIVAYAGAAGLVLESTPGSRKGRILEALDRLEAGGSTAGGAGLRLAYHVAQENFLRRGNNRVILATDGDFNVGESSDAAMVRLIEEERNGGTFLTVLGFGTGNLQSEKMQQLSQHGNGNYAYIDSIEEARKALVGEMGGTLLTVAKDVKVQIEFNPARVRAYRLLGYENRLLAPEDFNDDTKDAGEIGAGHTVTALYEIVLTDAVTDVETPRVDPLRYQAARPTPGQVRGGEIAFVKVRYKTPRGTESRLLDHPVRFAGEERSCDFSFAAAVAGFGMLLRESEYRGSISARQVLALAEEGLGSDRDGYRREFLELVRAYEALTGDR